MQYVISTEMVIHALHLNATQMQKTMNRLLGRLSYIVDNGPISLFPCCSAARNAVGLCSKCRDGNLCTATHPAERG